MKHLAVLCGGRSAEHEVSLISTASILKYLDRSRYQISVLGIRRDGGLYEPAELIKKLGIEPGPGLGFPPGGFWLCALLDLKPAVDVVFPVLHGPNGEDGTVQGALEVAGLPFVGAGVWASAVGMNKLHSKRLLVEAGLPVLPFLSAAWPEWERDRAAVLDRVEGALHYFVFVKPANLGSSVGVSKSRNRAELEEHIQLAFRYDDTVVVEQGINAREIELAVLGNFAPEVSIAGEILPAGEFYTYESKYLDQGSELLIPAPLGDSEMKRVQQLALEAYRTLQLEGMARMDFLMERENGKFWINEPNTIPGFTQISMYPKLWEASGLSYPDLLDRLVELGLERQQRRARFLVDRL